VQGESSGTINQQHNNGFSETSQVVRRRKTIAVIPAFNEAARIKGVIEATLRYAGTVAVVNDCSTDDTSDIAGAFGAIVHDLKVNMGAGYATRIGCDWAVQNGAEIIVTIDADGQHDPDDIPRLANILIKENLDIVFGYRPRNQNMPLINRMGGTLLFSLSRLLFNVNIEDTQTGFHVFTKQCYPKLRWKSNRYGFVSEFVYKVSKHNLRYKEVPIKTIYYNEKQGMRKRDGIKSILLMLLWRFGLYNLLYRLLNRN